MLSFFNDPTLTSIHDYWKNHVAAAAKSLQSCPTLCDPIDGSPPGSPVPGFSRQEHWSGLPFPSPTHESAKWKWSRSVVSDSVTPWTAAHQAPPSMGFSRQEYWSGVPSPSPTGKTIALTIWKFVSKIMSLLFNMLSRLIIAFLARSKHLLISWLQSPPAVSLEPKKIVSHCFPIYLPWSDGTACMIFVFLMLSFKPAFHYPLSFSSWGSLVPLHLLPKGGVICIS